MTDRWYYTHGGSPQGPVSHEQLKQLAAAGKLASTDLVWPEGGDPRRAVKAESVLPADAFGPATATPANWLGKMSEVLATKPSSPSTTPDWLSDLQQAAPAPAAPKVSRPPPLPAIDVVPVGPLLPRQLPSAPRLVLSGASSRGLVRERNEDRFLVRLWTWNDAEKTHEVALLVVADGMGGYQAGDKASSLTVRTVLAHFEAIVGVAIDTQAPSGPYLRTAVARSLGEANRVVHQQAGKEEQCKGMGATAAVVLIWDGLAYYSHVGDCRVYLHRGNDLTQLTEDQTLVARLVAMGQLTAEEAARHEARNEVTQAIGKRPTVTPSEGEQVLQRGDYLVVACDGLAAHVEDKPIRQVLSGPSLPPQHLASLLVSMADEAGGTDNCTVVIASFA